MFWARRNINLELKVSTVLVVRMNMVSLMGHGASPRPGRVWLLVRKISDTPKRNIRSWVLS